MNDDLRGQYENYPYPPRDPAEEATRLITGSPSHIFEIEHHILSGIRVRAKTYRILIAGGGTGDATVMLAAQHAAAGIDAEIIHLDISRASSAIAKARYVAQIRYGRAETFSAATGLGSANVAADQRQTDVSPDPCRGAVIPATRPRLGDFQTTVR